ncbi:MAG: SMC-Scp complex subunit ScpB [Pseudomonadota bacterium]
MSAVTDENAATGHEDLAPDMTEGEGPIGADPSGDDAAHAERHAPEAPFAPLDLRFDAATLERLVEAILFASAEPMSPRDIAGRLPEGHDDLSAITTALASLETRYCDRGVRLVRAGPAYAFRTATDLAGVLSTPRSEEKPMSRAGIETLAIIAYHQPVTRTEIEEVRGVGVSKGTLDFLLELGWVRLGPRRETPGRPATFVTTTAFLDHFGLSSARDLPGLKELRAAGLLDHEPPMQSEDGAPDDLFDEDPADSATG